MGDDAIKLRPRPPLRRFAEKMEGRLRANERKGGWVDLSYDHLLLRAMMEASEAARTLTRLPLSREGVLARHDRQAFIRECVDAANFLMMAADNASRAGEED